ncbi:hypothetical protein [Haloarcula onubensis]|uniref:Uncharacterized protein n=1 Tax=Haloarcula onubensis TaxID=2950539 RepID=A0ABU2FP01_9EURY|nr:hypothetical protein [Halomicroarcula sp. S3CR25-11]MDS0282494.1 hypothetical protein [Halomicroarcula sp. S3CR25-11]
MFDRTYTRRTLLRRSLATAGAGALVGAAGCSSIPNPLGGGASYADWLPVPDDIGDSDHYNFTYLNLDDFESNEDEIDEESFDPASYEDFWDPLDIDWEDVSGLTILGFGGMFGFGGLVIEAEFNRDDVISDLEDEDFDEDGDHEGYTLMLDESESQVYAIGDGAAVLTPARDTDGESSSGETGTAEAVIDAKTGNADRYADDSEAMSTLVDELGGGTLVSGRTMEEPEDASPENGTFDAMVAQGQQAKINGETTDVKYVVVYESSDDVDTGDLEDWVDENDGSDEQFDDVDDISYNQNGRTGVISGTINTDDL